MSYLALVGFSWLAFFQQAKAYLCVEIPLRVLYVTARESFLAYLHWYCYNNETRIVSW